jgi:histidine ammonia-lyase
MRGVPVMIGANRVTLAEVASVARGGAPVTLDPAIDGSLRCGRAVVEAALAAGTPTYGLNTGLGHLHDESIARDAQDAYQRGIIRSHLGGVGPPLARDAVRALIFARVVGMARGGSGARPEACHDLVALLNAGICPVVPIHGSVGASDLMHMAAIAAVLIGEGQAWLGDTLLTGKQALEGAGLAPYQPQAKDALALISANGASIGVGALAVLDAVRAADLSDHAALLSLEAYGGHAGVFDREVAEAKPFRGQIETAARMRDLLEGSSLLPAPGSGQVQDPLSFRVVLQVHGALRDALSDLTRVVETELNAIDDNPMVSVTNNRLISNGNFHPMQLALGFDSLRVVLAHVAMLAERRLNKTAPHAFGSPDDPPAPRGRPLGLELSSYAAATLVGEMRFLASPISVGCPPLDLDTEDHATLAFSAVRRTREAIEHLETILLIEALNAADCLRRAGDEHALGAGVKRLLDAVEDDGWSSGEAPHMYQAVETARQAWHAMSTSTWSTR